MEAIVVGDTFKLPLVKSYIESKTNPEKVARNKQQYLVMNTLILLFKKADVVLDLSTNGIKPEVVFGKCDGVDKYELVFGTKYVIFRDRAKSNQKIQFEMERPLITTRYVAKIKTLTGKI